MTVDYKWYWSSLWTGAKRSQHCMRNPSSDVIKRARPLPWDASWPGGRELKDQTRPLVTLHATPARRRKAKELSLIWRRCPRGESVQGLRFGWAGTSGSEIKSQREAQCLWPNEKRCWVQELCRSVTEEKHPGGWEGATDGWMQVGQTAMRLSGSWTDA